MTISPVMIDRLDHLVLTAKSIEKTIGFYVDVLGMENRIFKDGRSALHFGNQKINLHEYGNEFDPKALVPRPGSADLCFISTTPIVIVEHHLHTLGIPIEQGPVERTGASGPIMSIYIRDPDGNLIEISNQL